MDPATDLRPLEALLCTVLVRAGGTLRLPAAEAAVMNDNYTSRPATISFPVPT
jgi:hypothetical protein